MPGEPGLATCSPYSFSRVRSTSSSSTSITTSGRALSIAWMMRPAAATRSGVSLMVMALVAATRRQPAGIDDDAQDVDGLLQIGVAEEERADDLLLVLAALGGGVGNHRHGARRGDPPEMPGARRQRRERLVDRGVAKIDAHRLVAEGRVEDDAEVGELGDGDEDVAGAGLAEHQRLGQRDVGRHVGAGQGGGEAVLDQRLERGLARPRSPPGCAAATAARASRPGPRRWPG